MEEILPYLWSDDWQPPIQHYCYHTHLYTMSARSRAVEPQSCCDGRSDLLAASEIFGLSVFQRQYVRFRRMLKW